MRFSRDTSRKQPSFSRTSQSCGYLYEYNLGMETNSVIEPGWSCAVSEQPSPARLIRLPVRLPGIDNTEATTSRPDCHKHPTLSVYTAHLRRIKVVSCEFKQPPAPVSRPPQSLGEKATNGSKSSTMTSYRRDLRTFHLTPTHRTRTQTCGL